MKSTFLLAAIAIVIAAVHVVGDGGRIRTSSSVVGGQYPNGAVVVTLNASTEFYNLQAGLRFVLCGGEKWDCLPGYRNDKDLYLAPGQANTSKTFIVQTNTSWLMYELIGLPLKVCADASYYFGGKLPVSVEPVVPLAPVQARGKNQVVVQVVGAEVDPFFPYVPFSTIQQQLWNNLDLSELNNSSSAAGLTLVESSVVWDAGRNNYMQNFTLACDHIQAQIQIQGVDWPTFWNLSPFVNVFGYQDVYRSWYPSYVQLDSHGVPTTAMHWCHRIELTGVSYRKDDWQGFDYIRGRIYSASQYFKNASYHIHDEDSIHFVKSWSRRNSTALSEVFTFSLSGMSEAGRVYIKDQLNSGKIYFAWVVDVTAKLVEGGICP